MNKEIIQQATINTLSEEITQFLDGRVGRNGQLNLGFALYIYEPSNFGMTVNIDSGETPDRSALMNTWTRYKHCDESTKLTCEAYNEYLDDEEGEDFDFDLFVYESMVMTLRELKSGYNLELGAFDDDFFWALRFADPSANQAKIEREAFRSLNSPRLFSHFWNPTGT